MKVTPIPTIGTVFNHGYYRFRVYRKIESICDIAGCGYIMDTTGQLYMLMGIMISKLRKDGCRQTKEDYFNPRDISTIIGWYSVEGYMRADDQLKYGIVGKYDI